MVSIAFGNWDSNQERNPLMPFNCHDCCCCCCCCCCCEGVIVIGDLLMPGLCVVSVVERKEDEGEGRIKADPPE